MKNRNFNESLQNALHGVLYSIKKERNMRIHSVASLIAIVIGFLLKLNEIEFILIGVGIGVVIICELFNTAIEVIVDVVVLEYDPKAKIIKDVAAGAALVASIMSLFIAYFIIFKKLYFKI